MSGPGDISLTQCPHCDTVFQVSEEQLQVAQGRVRCGRCQGVFDALAHPYEQPVENRAAAAPEPAASAPSPESDELDDTPYIIASRDDDPWSPPESVSPDDSVAPDAGPDKEAAPEPTPEKPDMASADPDVAAADEPQASVDLTQTLSHIDTADVLRDQLEAPPPPPAQTARNLAWSLLALLLMLALGAQYLFFARAELAQHETLRPLLERACGSLGCTLPLRHAPGQIELLNRDVISHPRIRNALLINATFVNRAGYAQVYPVLQISLSDESGAVVAMRRFQPEEYLAQGARVAVGMLPGAQVRVVLEVVEPTHNATSFQFEFL